jgi:hypothetical protein
LKQNNYKNFKNYSNVCLVLSPPYAQSTDSGLNHSTPKIHFCTPRSAIPQLQSPSLRRVPRTCPQHHTTRCDTTFPFLLFCWYYVLHVRFGNLQLCSSQSFWNYLAVCLFLAGAGIASCAFLPFSWHHQTGPFLSASKTPRTHIIL